MDDLVKDAHTAMPSLAGRNKVTLIEPDEVGSGMQGASPAQQRKAIKAGKMLRAEDIAVAVHYVLSQPARCDVTFLQIRPHIEDD